MSSRVRVLVVDDQRMFTDALEALLAGQEGLESAGVASSAEEAMDLCRRQCPDVVLMDVGLPGMDGIEGIRWLRQICSGVQVVVISALPEGDVLAKAVEVGACGFVPKTHAADELLRMVHRAAGGEMVFATGQIEASLGRLREARSGVRGTDVPTVQLTSREVEILQAFADGLSTPEVSAHLFLSVHTVNHHTGSILRKLGCRSKLQAVLLALRQDIIELRQRS